MQKDNNYKQATLAVHGGYEIDPTTKSANVPLYQTAAYHYDSTEHAASLFELSEFGNIYSRLQNPTCEIFEKRIAMLEKGAAGLSFSSGMAAITGVVQNLCEKGDNIVTSSSLYGGTATLFAHTIEKWGIKAKFVDASDPQNFADAIDSNTKIVYIETIGNPKNDVLEYEKIAEVAHQAGVVVVCDNTVASPILFNPIDHGVDIVIHSCTKMIDGHGSSIGGIVIDSGNFDWASGRYPCLTEPDESYHGVKFYEQFGNIAFIIKLRVQVLRDTGACLSPFNAFMFLHGVTTLPLRAIRHSENALALAKFLEANESVSWVNYPGLESHPDFERAQKYLPKGQGGILGFGIKGGKQAGEKFINNVKLASHITNLLDARTMVVHPATTTHQQLTEQEQEAAGVTSDFIRVSVGIEDIDDLIADFAQALEKSQK
ncbi:MAG: O-acetylhomoserine aminocarboxypropyltransferase/cysteine synthase family protein [Sedimentisphaeraceae bacterium JB056]